MTFEVSLVVCTLNRPHCVTRLVKAVLAGDLVPEEILIIDASEPEEAQELASQLEAQAADGVRHVVVAPSDRGLTKQRNVGIRAARGQLVAFLDDDCVPERGYFLELVAAMERYPSAVGVGGLVDEGQWLAAPAGARGRADDAGRFDSGWIFMDGWKRREGSRWRLRRRLRLAPVFAPGQAPPEGHGWPIGYLAPGDGDVRVHYFMGGASLWRRSLFEKMGFSPWFEGYGLYEDQDFCLRAKDVGELWVARGAQLRHLHEMSARPRAFRYGCMVVVNGWRVWRRGTPRPSMGARSKWWAVTYLLAGVRASNAFFGPGRIEALTESLGRLWGAVVVIVRSPSLATSEASPLGSTSRRNVKSSGTDSNR